MAAQSWHELVTTLQPLPAASMQLESDLATCKNSLTKVLASSAELTLDLRMLRSELATLRATHHQESETAAETKTTEQASASELDKLGQSLNRSSIPETDWVTLVLVSAGAFGIGLVVGVLIDQ